jgi:uncharacterized delta-60 repeat protein
MRTIIATLIALALSPAAALAAPGDLDPSFDGDGKLALPFYAEPKAVFTQPDGKILVAGTASEDFAVWRFNDDGSPDRSFGGDGAAAVGFGGRDELRAAALQPDGKIVLVGAIDVSSSPAVARLTAEGELDATFAPGGLDGDGKRVLTDAELTFAGAALVQPDGRIVLAGQFNDDFAVVRLKDNGAIDDTTFERADFGYVDEATAAALTPAGEIVVAGFAYGPPMLADDNQAALVRYGADGKLDKTLGKVTFGAEGTDEPSTVLVRPDGGVLVVGYVRSGDPRTFVTPVSRDGAVGAGFAGADFYGPDGEAGAVLRPDGRIVLAASVGYDVGVAQLTAGGGLDGAFGAGGRTLFSFGDANAARAVALQADGKIVVAAITLQGLAKKMALARLLGDPPPATPSGGPPAVAPRCGGRAATIVGTAGRDVLRGTRRADVIVALGGADRVLARGGNDLVCGGAGNDRLSGGAGRDRLLGEGGRDRLLGGGGRDRLVGGPGRDRARQ